MSVWYCIPSKRPPEQAERCLKLWRERGYKIGVYRDYDDPELSGVDLQVVSMVPYQGYAMAVNSLVWHVLFQEDRKCDWIVTGGDDVEPDRNHSAEEIAQQCSNHFYGCVELGYPPDRPAWAEIRVPSPGGSGKDSPSWKRWSTFGVMQPSGDRYGESAGSIATYGADRAAYADRVCGSPWIGREFALRVNQGKGPLWPEYFHMFEDEELFEVASRLGVLWMRRDLIHLHNHWARKRGDAADMPEFLKEASGPEHWKKYGAIFRARKAAGFPGSEPL